MNLHDYVDECLNPMTTFSLIEKMIDLDPSNIKRTYKNLQNMVYYFMQSLNLTFKNCQTTSYEDEDLVDVITAFRGEVKTQSQSTLTFFKSLPPGESKIKFCK